MQSPPQSKCSHAPPPAHAPVMPAHGRWIFVVRAGEGRAMATCSRPWVDIGNSGKAEGDQLGMQPQSHNAAHVTGA